MRVAAEAAATVPAASLITSIGEPAAQSVSHLHVHIVPREPGDGPFP
jgi:histidine triad (HIT) family protein